MTAAHWKTTISLIQPNPELTTLSLVQILHDFQHGGLSNDFLVQSSDPLALLYNDRSPLENHHVSAGTRLMAQPVSIRTKVGTCSYCKS
jgi:hypothetical protein